MNKETVTLKKNSPPVVQIAAAAVLIAVLNYLSRISLPFYAVSLFLILVLTIYLVDFISETIKYFTDKERLVVVRKSSVENTVAKEYIRKAQKTRDTYKLIGAIAACLFITIVTVLAIAKNVDKKTFTYAYILNFAIVFVIYGRIVTHGNSKVGKMDLEILNACDLTLMFDTQELRRLKLLSNREKAAAFFIEALTAYYQEDYELMHSKIQRLKEFNKDIVREIYAIEFEGSACIRSDNPDGFNRISDMLKRLEEKNKTNREYQALAASARLRWDILIGWKSKEPDKVYEMAIEGSSAVKTYKLMNMELTYILAELQEMKGLYDMAEYNYKLVADGAGSMAIRKYAVEKLDRIKNRNAEG